MTIWETLEIEPTDNISIIKKAYAKKLKIHHPEDDPEGYQCLREAYDSAIKKAKLMTSGSSLQEDIKYKETSSPTRWLNVTDERDSLEHPVNTFIEEREAYNSTTKRAELMTSGSSLQEDIKYKETSNPTHWLNVTDERDSLEHPVNTFIEEQEAYDSAIKRAELMASDSFLQEDIEYEETANPALWLDVTDELDSATTLEHPVSMFMEEIAALYDDFFARIELKNWEKLLNSDVVWDVQHTSTLQNRLILFLEDHYYLPRPIWELFDQMFHWREQEEELIEEHSEETIQLLLQHINGAREMRYQFFREIDDLDYELFLQLREEVQLALMDNDLEATEDLLKEAYQLYSKDPDLLHMQGIYYMRIGHTKHALQSFNDVLSICPDDPDGLMYRARIRYDNSQFSKAINDCKQLLSHHPKHADAMLLIVKCYLEMGEDEQAYNWADKCRKISPGHLEIYSRLSQSVNPSSGTFSSEIAAEEQESIQSGKKLIVHSIFLRRIRGYIGFFIIAPFTPLPFKYIALMFIPLIWDIWRCYQLFKYHNLFYGVSDIHGASKDKHRKQFELYLQLLSLPFGANPLMTYYFVDYKFTFIRDRLIGNRELMKALKDDQNINDATELKDTIHWLLEANNHQQFNQIRYQLSALSETARNQYIQSWHKDGSKYAELFIANQGLHAIPASGISAFYWGSVIYLCRVGRRVGYLTKQEAQDYMIKAAQLLQQSYSGWTEYMNALIVGSYFYNSDIEFKYDQYHFPYTAMFFAHPKTPLLKIKWENTLLKNLD
ncbi:DUF1266 domain-containing protein [Bacillus sp. FJAT-52991]|uniref:DUF1266 domain-containing protein n=1 Tax=Bacillus kandeliae TaxID=3129297 RepID=A0ABZ2N7Z7_9BACI